ncbi:MAG TPA: hypothetical protein VGI60_14210 [Chthoniobacterales bacterium]
MKKLLFTLATAAAALFALADQASAGMLTLDDGSPAYTPPGSFTNNTIVVDTTIGDGSLIHLSGGVTVTPDATNLATIAVSGTYAADAGDQFSVAYKFASDLATDTSIAYTLTLNVNGIDLPPQSGTIDPGLHEYEGTAAVPVVLALTGTFSGTLTLDFSSPGANAAIAVPGSLDLTVQQLDFMLDPTAVTVTPASVQQNISTRLDVGTGDDVLIGGFIITGTDTDRKLVVLRGLGPSLNGKIGAASFLPDPVIELHDSTGAVVATNDNWMDLSADDQTVLTDNDLAPGDPSESALVETLAPDSYTVIMSGANGGTGVGLVEAYDLDNGTTDSKLANISTRGSVDSGDNVMIGGFIIGGGGLSQIVVRGLGPSLSDQVSGALADPVIQVANGDGDIIDTNDNWMDDPNSQTVSDFGLAPTDPNESALYEILEPGNYTVLLSGSGGTSGIGLVESYNVDGQ